MLKTEIKKVLYRFLQDGISSDEAAQQVLDLFAVSGQLPPSQISDKEYKKLMKALYPKDRSKKFRR